MNVGDQLLLPFHVPKIHRHCTRRYVTVQKVCDFQKLCSGCIKEDSGQDRQITQPSDHNDEPWSGLESRPVFAKVALHGGETFTISRTSRWTAFALESRYVHISACDGAPASMHVRLNADM